MAKYTAKPEAEETPEDELKESPELQAKEAAEGTEEHDTETGEKLDDEGEEEEETTENESVDGQDVKVPEAFQKEVTTLVQSATKHQLEFLRSLITERESELSKSESPSEKASVFDMEGMPD